MISNSPRHGTLRAPRFQNPRRFWLKYQ